VSWSCCYAGYCYLSPYACACNYLFLFYFFKIEKNPTAAAYQHLH
jgi:hypothetical protein